MDKYIHIYNDVVDVIDGIEIEGEQRDDVTALVLRTFRELDEAKKKVAALQKEITDIKNRRGWDEVEMVTNKETGMSAVIRTTYRWQADTMRLDFSDEMYRGMGYVQ